MHNKNVDALKHAKLPTTKTQLKIFLGMCNVHRRFVKDFAERAKPLNALTMAEIPPDLPPPTDVAIAAFEDHRHYCAHRYLPYQRQIVNLSSTLTHAPTRLVVHFSRRSRANWFILSDIEAEDSPLPSKTTQQRRANASASCGRSSI